MEGCVFEKQCSAESYVGLLQCDVDVNTAEPQDTLTPLARKAVEELGSPCTTVSAIISTRDPAVFSATSQGLERANQKAASNAQKVSGTFYQLSAFNFLCFLLVNFYRFRNGPSSILIFLFQEGS